VNAAFSANIPTPAAKRPHVNAVRAAFLHLDFDLEQL
jgi:hypothetical protein